MLHGDACDDSVPDTTAENPPHLVLASHEHEWPADFEAFVARELVGRDGALVARLGELEEAPSLLSASNVAALIVNANRLGLKGKAALQECRRISPSTALVVVRTTLARGLKDALEGGATAFLSWPASPDLFRRALRGTLAPAPVAGTEAQRTVGR